MKAKLITKYNILILITCIFLIGCPYPIVVDPVVVDPIVVDPVVVDPVVVDPVVVDPVVVDPVVTDPVIEDWDLNPFPDPNFVPQQCKLEWGNGASFNSYEDMMNLIRDTLANSTCTANSILCVYVGMGTACHKIWEFKTMDDIPKKTITDACGNNVIYFRDQDNDPYKELDAIGPYF